MLLLVPQISLITARDYYSLSLNIYVLLAQTLQLLQQNALLIFDRLSRAARAVAVLLPELERGIDGGSVHLRIGAGEKGESHRLGLLLAGAVQLLTLVVIRVRVLSVLAGAVTILRCRS